MGILERVSVPKEARKCSAAQGPHSEVVPRAFWRLVSKSCDGCKGSFARGCEAKRWSHWTCSSLGTIFHPMRINSVPDVKCFCNNKNVLCVQSMVWHFVHHTVIEVPISMPGMEGVQQWKMPIIYTQSGIQAHWMSILASLSISLHRHMLNACDFMSLSLHSTEDFWGFLFITVFSL